MTTFIDGKPETCLFDRDIEDKHIRPLPLLDRRKKILAGPLTCRKLVNGRYVYTLR